MQSNVRTDGYGGEEDQKLPQPLRYKLRHLVENAFLFFKRWRGIVTRYAKNTTSFVAAVQIRCIATWFLLY